MKKGKKKGGKKKISLALKIILTYTSLIGLLYLLFLLFYPTAMIFGQVVYGVSARVINLILFVIIAVVVYGLYSEQRWAWLIAGLWYSLNSIDSLVSVVSVEMMDIVGSFVRTALVYIILTNVLILIYILSKKFVKFKMTDRLFSRIFSVVSILFAVAILVLANSFFNSFSKKVDKVVNDIQDKTFDEAIVYCETSNDRDICYLTAAFLFNATDGTCEYIESEFYKLTCSKGVR